MRDAASGLQEENSGETLRRTFPIWHTDTTKCYWLPCGESGGFRTLFLGSWCNGNTALYPSRRCGFESVESILPFW